MKKLLTMAMAAAFTLVAAGKVQATALETKGEFRARYWNLSDYFQTMKPVADQNTEFWDQRLRLYMTWPVSESVKVQVKADIFEQVWGGDPGNLYGTNNQIAFDWAYAQFALGSGVNVAVGKMDVSWGPGAVTKADNRTRLKLTGKAGDIGLGFAWDKNKETLHDVTADDHTHMGDYDGYTFWATTKAADFNLGAYYSLTVDESVDNKTVTRHWFNAYTQGKVGGVSIDAEVGYKFGTDEVTGSPDKDASGLAAYVGLKAPVGPATLGAEFAYAQGDDPSTSENEGDMKMEYNSPFWSVILFNNFDLPGWESSYTGDTGVANAWAGKLSFAVPVMPSLTLYGAAVYAARLEDTATKNADPLGTELDLIAMFKVSDNVGINVGAGYLMVGDYYGDSIDDPWGATVHFVVNF